MAHRASKLDFGRSLFSAADMAHASYLFRNPRTLMTGDGMGGFNPLAPAEGARRAAGDAAKEIVRAMDDWYAAKREGDRNSMFDAARTLIGATIAHQKEQGGRGQARKLLPPAFVEAEANEIRSAPPQQRPAMVRSLVDRFDDHVKADVWKQVSGHLSTGSSNPSIGERAVRDVMGSGLRDDRRPAMYAGQMPSVDPTRQQAQLAYRDNQSDDRFQVAGGYGGGRPPTPTPTWDKPPPDWQSRPAPKPPSRPGCVAKDGMVTCQPPNGLPPISFPRPQGWDDEYFDETEWEYHDYRVVEEDDYIPPPGTEKEYEDRLFQSLVEDPTPGADRPASREGQRNDVGPLGPASGLGRLFGGNPNYVKSYIVESGGRKFVVNVTEGSHYLSPGYVVRTVVRMPNGRYAIVTIGSGVDWMQADSLPLGWYAKNYEVQQPWKDNSKAIFKKARARK